MKVLRSVTAVLLGYALVVLITEFGFRLFPGGRAPKDVGAGAALALLIAATAGFTGGFAAASLSRFRPVLSAAIVAAPLFVETTWLLTTKTPAGELAKDALGSVVLIGSVFAGGITVACRQSRRLRSSATLPS